MLSVDTMAEIVWQPQEVHKMQNEIVHNRKETTMNWHLKKLIIHIVK